MEHGGTSKHHPNGGASAHCDNGQIEFLIAQYQKNRDVESLSSIIELTQSRALTLIRFYRTTRYRSRDELLSDVNFKLMRAVSKFNPEKGSAFTFVSQVIKNVLCTSVSNRRKDLHRYKRLSKVVLNGLHTNGEVESKHAVDDLRSRVKSSVKTTIEDANERDVQRWFVTSFCDERFSECRHQCANAAMAVYGVNHFRSRELYDLTMLEVRRVLYDDLQQRAQIAPGRLFGTRSSWLSRYASLMNPTEFTKFVALMRDLSPFVLLLIDPQARSRRPDRNPSISRKNIELILYGDPDAVPLFAVSD